MNNDIFNIIKNKYTFEKELNHGEFGKVYRAKHKITNENVVIKIERKSVLSLLLYEIKMYNYLKSYNYISKIRNYYSDISNNILIIDYNGISLYELKNRINVNNMREKINYINKLVVFVIDALEALHDYNYLYRDLKPHNICYNNNGEIKLIDLGFCTPFIINGKHIINKKISKILGTPNYVSKNIIELNTPSRRDDIESIFYLYLFFILSDIIWKNYGDIDNNKKKDYNLIRDILININNNLYENILNIKKLLNYLEFVRNIEFDGKPNYNNLKLLIKSI